MRRASVTARPRLDERVEQDALFVLRASAEDGVLSAVSASRVLKDQGHFAPREMAPRAASTASARP